VCGLRGGLHPGVMVLENADSKVEMTSYLLMEETFCPCEDLCVCGWNDDPS
jgi:hypothetical protein